MGVAESKKDERCHRQHLKEQQDECQPAYQANSENVQARDQHQKYNGDRPVHESAVHRSDLRDVIRQHHSIRGPHEKCPSPVPPAALETPEIAKCCTSPTIKTSFHRHRCCHFR